MAAATFTSIYPSGGATVGGDAVTITGTNLTGSTGITFGGVAATSVVVVSATSITCVTPAGSGGLGTIVIQNPGGDATASNAFLYVNVPTAINTFAQSIRTRLSTQNAKDFLGGVQQILDRDEDPAIIAKNSQYLPTLLVFPFGEGKYTITQTMGGEPVLDEGQIVIVGYYRFSKDNTNPYADIDTTRAYGLKCIGLFRGYSGATPNFLFSQGVLTKAVLEIKPYQEENYVLDRFVITFSAKLAEG